MNANELMERFLDFAADVISLENRLKTSASSIHIFNQLQRSATSAGANYSEACSAESQADFVHKMQIVLKEMRESFFWLKLLQRTEKIANEMIKPLIDESNEFISILVKSIYTSKQKQRNK